MDYQSWGRYPRRPQQAHPVYSQYEALPSGPRKLLAYGRGRSYGDVCLNSGHLLLHTAGLKRFLAFDRREGILRCEAGVTLAEILALIVPAGWFLPVTPGTQFVTVGGAAANDVHGKNHHGAGTFGRHIRCFELLRSDGERLLCSAERNADWFAATIAGLGLTGLILWLEFKLVPLHNPWILNETIRFGDLEEFYALSRESERDYAYSVAWLDCLSGGRGLGRGLFMRGNHAPPLSTSARPAPSSAGPRIPFDFPGFALNPYSIKAFNALYYRKQWVRRRRSLEHYRPFFYPLDGLREWNRIYGGRGFFQYQCVLPEAHAARELLKLISASGQGSFLSVMKVFGALPSPGLLSFPRPGFTLALDFPNRGKETLKLLQNFDALTAECGGAVYPAKDARMSAAHFQVFYPRIENFSRFIDPRFSSDFWRRAGS